MAEYKNTPSPLRGFMDRFSFFTKLRNVDAIDAKYGDDFGITQTYQKIKSDIQVLNQTLQSSLVTLKQC